MTKAERAEQQQAIAQLREWIKPGDTVYTILDHVSRSGMQRAIRVVLPTIGGPSIESSAPGGKPTDYVRRDGVSVDFLHPNHAIGKALRLRHWRRNGREQDALTIGGCGMDMGFHLVYSLSQVLYGREGYACLGKGKCPSSYHVNHRDRLRCDGIGTGDDRRLCYRPNPYNGRWEVPEDWPRSEPITLESSDGSVTLPGHLLACVRTREDDGAYEVCPTCHGAGDVPNPDGPERFDLVHTDGCALRHRWL